MTTYNKAKYERNKESHRNAMFKFRYGITLKKYNELLEKQDGRCAICRKFETHLTHPNLTVDHDHDYGWIRGLLCHRCNVALGLFGDDSKTLKRAYKYLSNGGFDY